MANIAQMINVLQAMILTDKEKMIVTPTYWVFEMFTVHHDATLLPSELQSADYAVRLAKNPGRQRLGLARQGGQNSRDAVQSESEPAGGGRRANCRAPRRRSFPAAS